MIYVENIETPVKESSIADLDSKEVLKYLQLATGLDATVKFEDKVVLNLILGQKIAVKKEDRIILTVGGVLVFVKDPEKFLPYYGVIFTRHPQSVREQFREQFKRHSFNFNISKTLFDVIETINVLTQRSGTQGGLRHVDTIGYPFNVLQEVLANAMVHRDYSIACRIWVNLFSNKLEVKSPGLPPSGITRENMRAGYPVHRNPLLYNYACCLGLGEQRGGLPRIIAQMEQLGRGVEIEFEAPFVKVTIEGPRPE